MRKSLLEMLSDINDEVVPVSNVGDKAAIEDAVEKEDTSEKQEDVIGNKVFRNHKNKLFFGAKKQKTPKEVKVPDAELKESVEEPEVKEGFSDEYAPHDNNWAEYKKPYVVDPHHKLTPERKAELEKQGIEIKESANDMPEERFEYMTSKSVPDYDGFMTDYTMYYDNQDKRYVFVFGDNEVYLPEDEDFDYECDTEKEAYEWFDNYEGFVDDFPMEESINERLEDAPKEVLDAVMDVLIKNDFKLDSSIKHENPFNYDGRWHIQVINDNEKVTDEDDFYAKMKKYDAMLDEISEIGDRENCPVTYNFGANRDMYITGGIDIREKYIEESFDINESTSEHLELEKEVYTIVENLIDEALDNLAMRLPEMIAGYNPDWCADESDYDFVHYKGEFIDAIVSELFKNDYGDIEESLTEASYGGAYDIADDQYFTKDELVEFAEEIIDELDCGKCELVDVEMNGNALSICIDCDGVEECVTMTIDMRKIKSPRHIMKYTTPFVKEFTKRFCTTNESMELNELNLKNIDADELQYQKDMKAYKDSLTPNEAISDKIYNQLTNTAYNKKYGAKAIDYEAVLLDEEDNNIVCADDMTRALNVCEKEGYKHSEPRPLGKGENGSVYGSYKMTIYNPKV